MLTASPSRRTVQGATFAVWALAAASAAYWALKISASQSTFAPPALPATGPAAIDAPAVARVLGATPSVAAAAPSLASRFVLVGVVAGTSGHTGAALIGVDGKPAKPFRVGASVAEGFVLKAVEGRRAVLAATASGPDALTLELPPPRR